MKKSECSMIILFGLTIAVTCSLVFADAKIFVAEVSPASAYPNEIVRLMGGGATPRGPVTAMLSGPVNQTIIIGNGSLPLIYLGSQNMTLASTLAEISGNWSLDFITPRVYPGDYHISVIDNNSMTSDTVNFRVLMNVTVIPITNITFWPFPYLSGTIRIFTQGTATPSFGPPGSLVTVSATSSSTGQIIVYFENTQVATISSPASPQWSATFQVPNVPAGNYTIRAIDAAGGWMSITHFTVTQSSESMLAVPSVMLFGLFALALIAALSMLMFLAAEYRWRRLHRKTIGNC